MTLVVIMKSLALREKLVDLLNDLCRGLVQKENVHKGLGPVWTFSFLQAQTIFQSLNNHFVNLVVVL